MKQLPDTPNTPPDVVALVEQIRGVRRKMLRIACLSGGTFVTLIIAILLTGRTSFWLLPVIASYMLTTLATIIAFFWFAHNINKLQKQFVGVDDVQYIGHVIQSVGDSFRPDSALVNTLVNLLGKLQASDVHFLGPNDRLVLNKLLCPDYWCLGYHSQSFTSATGTMSSHHNDVRMKLEDRTRLVLATLKALEQVGDAGAIAPVRQLTRSYFKFISSAAQECLPYLYQRANEQREANGLLRPADNTNTPDVLLRPAVATADVAPEQLLRADSKDAPVH